MYNTQNSTDNLPNSYHDFKEVKTQKKFNFFFAPKYSLMLNLKRINFFKNVDVKVIIINGKNLNLCVCCQKEIKNTL